MDGKEILPAFAGTDVEKWNAVLFRFSGSLIKHFLLMCWLLRLAELQEPELQQCKVQIVNCGVQRPGTKHGLCGPQQWWAPD